MGAGADRPGRPAGLRSAHRDPARPAGDAGGAQLIHRLAEVDLGVLRSNVAALRARLPPGTRFIAVVKADAYGHGAVPVAQAALAAGAAMLAVVTLDEADEVGALIDDPARVLVLGPLLPEEAARAAAGGFSVSVSSAAVVEALAATGAPVPVHVEVDTGMTRYGALPEEAAALCRRVAALPPLVLAGAWTHFSASEADVERTREQVTAFRAVPGVAGAILHAANSGAVVSLPGETAFDAVRVGIAMYGCEAPGLTRPVLSLRSLVAHLKEVGEGTPVGYGSTWRAGRRSRIATVPMGYADGVHRTRANRGHVLVRGREAPLVGRVSMDSITVDVTDLAGVAVGDRVTLIGEDGGAFISAEMVAGWSGTISYEVLTALGRRVERRYRD